MESAKLGEPEITKRILELARRSGFEKIRREKNDPDLVLSDGKYKYKIECKGVQKGKYKKANNQKAYNSALGQIIKCMRNEGVIYGIAFPDTPFFRKKVTEEIPRLVRRKLNLNFFLIKEKKTHLLNPFGEKTKSINRLPKKYGKGYR